MKYTVGRNHVLSVLVLLWLALCWQHWRGSGMFTGSLMKKQMYNQPMEGHKGCNTYRFLSQEEQSLQCVHIMHMCTYITIRVIMNHLNC